MPAGALGMIEAIDVYDPTGGTRKLGYVRGRKRIDPSAWFFKAHFFQDPVCPARWGWNPSSNS
jgi:3-hydroxymyristoyl/3-hydroxydecanoyl-(acyl carrier protein) dehydratase